MPLWLDVAVTSAKVKEMTEIGQFAKIAPYLKNPLVLAGFCLLLLYWICQAFLKARLLKPLSQRQSSAVVQLILKYGFQLAIFIIVIGFVYAGFSYHSDEQKHSQQGPIIQQTGSCGSNIAGDNNKTDLNCADKPAEGKKK
jgi:hypothetical protein